MLRRRELRSTFSFSSSSNRLGAGLGLIACRSGLFLDCVCSRDDTRRCGSDAPGCPDGFAAVDRESDETLGVGVGVPAIDVRGFEAGGGPMEPSIRFEDDALTAVTVPLVRTLLPRAAILAEMGVSIDSLRSFPTVLPVSESTEEGRDTEGVLKMAESRRGATREAGAGVLPPVPRTPILRFTWGGR